MSRRIELSAILTVWIFCGLAQSAPGLSGGSGVQVESVTLSPEHPAGSFPIDRETVAGTPAVLRVSVTNVMNPARTPIGIYVYLSPAGGGAERILVGNFALFPPDHPGGFMLGASKSWAELRSRGYSGEVELRVELRRIHPEKPWSSVEVTVAPPLWMQK
jgi:hypothetical protein